MLIGTTWMRLVSLVPLPHSKTQHAQFALRNSAPPRMKIRIIIYVFLSKPIEHLKDCFRNHFAKDAGAARIGRRAFNPGDVFARWPCADEEKSSPPVLG